MTSTLRRIRPSVNAAASPAGPAPTITASNICSSIWRSFSHHRHSARGRTHRNSRPVENEGDRAVRWLICTRTAARSGISFVFGASGTGENGRMPVIEISDLSDPRLADFAHATDVLLKNGHGPHGLYIAESALVLERALKAGHHPRSVLALGGTVDEAVALVGPDVPVFSGPGELLADLTGYILHRGLIASMHRPALVPAEELLADARRVVILENVVDPTNVGAIFRSVAAIGADVVLVTPRCSDPFYRRAIRVSMGTVLQVPWTRVGEWTSSRPRCTTTGCRGTRRCTTSCSPRRSVGAGSPVPGPRASRSSDRAP